MGYYVLGDLGFPSLKNDAGDIPTCEVRLKRVGFTRKGSSYRQELFNRCQSSVRIIIERTFGVVKARFRILTAMRPYS